MKEGFWDIHCHIIPGVDDGSRDLEMSKGMLDLSYEQGVRNMIATPHFYPGHRNASPEHVAAAFEELKSYAENKYKDFQLYRGNEIYYSGSLTELIEKGEAHTLANSRYVLLEFSYTVNFKDLKKAVYKASSNGYYPILAHIERYECLHNQMQLVKELVNEGAYIQLNGENFHSGLIVTNRSYCVKLIREGLVHFIASDTHNLKERKPNLGIAYEYLSHKVESEILNEILIENPKRILQNKYLD